MAAPVPGREGDGEVSVSHGFLDDALASGLDRAARAALSGWARMEGSAFRLDRWMNNGKSGAVVAVVDEENEFEGARRLVLKIDEEGDFERPEYTQQKKARADSPDFAREHLATAVHQPIAVGDGRWIVFQEVAGGSMRTYGVLTRLLDAATGADATDADAEAFARACRTVVHSTLRDWAVIPRRTPMTASEYVREHVGPRLNRPGRLRDLMATAVDAYLYFDEDEASLPNPLALLAEGPAADKPAGADSVVNALCGKTHGDLHTENILLRLEPSPAPDGYWLVDLAKYSARAPLARDATHLMLYVIARTLAGLSPVQRTALIRVLVDGDSGRGASQLPGWLRVFLTEIRAAGHDWLLKRALPDAWDDQTRLSLAGNALVFIGRRSTNAVARRWFLRLAGHALRESLPRTPAAVPARTAPAAHDPAASEPSRVWIAQLCEYLPTLRRLAAEAGLAGELDALVTSAQLGEDREDGFAHLVRKLGGSDILRIDVPGLGQGRPLFGEFHGCDGGHCPRREPRIPSGPVPRCALRSAPMPLRSE